VQSLPLSSTLLGLLRRQAGPPGPPIKRLWIDHSLRREELACMEEELLPAMEQFPGSRGEMDACPSKLAAIVPAEISSAA